MVCEVNRCTKEAAYEIFPPCAICVCGEIFSDSVLLCKTHAKMAKRQAYVTINDLHGNRVKEIT